MNSGPRPCLISVGFPLSGPQVRTHTSDLKQHARHTASAYGLGSDRVRETLSQLPVNANAGCGPDERVKTQLAGVSTDRPAHVSVA